MAPIIPEDKPSTSLSFTPKREAVKKAKKQPTFKDHRTYKQFVRLMEGLGLPARLAIVQENLQKIRGEKEIQAYLERMTDEVAAGSSDI